MSASLDTSCAHCGETFGIDIDSAGQCGTGRSDGAAPLLFEPRIDWERFTKPHIIDDF